MANPYRGYVELDVDGTTYKLKFDYNALAELDDKLGYSVGSATSDQLSSVKFLRAAFWAALQHDARWARMTLKQVGALMDKAGLEAAAESVFKAFALFRGKDADKGDGGAAPLEGQP